MTTTAFDRLRQALGGSATPTGEYLTVIKTADGGRTEVVYQNCDGHAYINHFGLAQGVECRKGHGFRGLMALVNAADDCSCLLYLNAFHIGHLVPFYKKAGFEQISDPCEQGYVDLMRVPPILDAALDNIDDLQDDGFSP